MCASGLWRFLIATCLGQLWGVLLHSCASECCWLCLEWALLQVNSAGCGVCLGDGNCRDLPSSWCRAGKQELSVMVLRLAGALTLREGNSSLFFGAPFLNSVFLWVARGLWRLSVPSLKPQCSGGEFPACIVLVESRYGGLPSYLSFLLLCVCVMLLGVCVSDLQ